VFIPVPRSALSRIQVHELLPAAEINLGFELEGFCFLFRLYFFILDRGIAFAFSTFPKYCASGLPLTVTEGPILGILSLLIPTSNLVSNMGTV
jgi:hypothetical protein